MSDPVPSSSHVTRVLDGPVRGGSELRWTVELAGGGRGVLARLLPELVRDEAVRRRYVRDLKRRAEMAHPGLAPLLDFDSDEAWRLRQQPAGTSVAAWLEERAPAPIEDAADLGAGIADILHALHERGVVVRDLHPRLIVLGPDGPVLTDVGLARVDLLSTRTAASLVLEGSPYASPEQLQKTVLDQRSDLFGLGVILWRALTGTLPYGDRIALLAEADRRRSLAELRPELPPTLAHLVERCVDLDPEVRPGSARHVAAVLRGEGTLDELDARVNCQNCGGSLRRGQRICTHCGRQAVVFEHSRGDQATHRLVLKKVKEDLSTMTALRETLSSVSAGRVPALNFIVGDQRMYSKAEQRSRLKLPLTLFSQLDPSTANALAKRFTDRGLAVEVRDGTYKPKAALYVAAAAVAVVAGIAAAGLPTMALAIAIAMGLVAVAVTAIAVKSTMDRQSTRPPLLRLREGPAALPASDPLVARLAALIDDRTPHDVKERIGELALVVQRLVDHRGQLAEAERLEVDMLTEPVEPLISVIESNTRRLAELDAELEDLDEGALVRGLAAAQARGATETEHEALLDGLDRLRGLEDQRAGVLHRLLEAASLLRRATELGMRVEDPKAQFDRDVELAIATLEG